jgi:hypothetical protein
MNRAAALLVLAGITLPAGTADPGRPHWNCAGAGIAHERTRHVGGAPGNVLQQENVTPGGQRVRSGGCGS